MNNLTKHETRLAKIAAKKEQRKNESSWGSRKEKMEKLAPVVAIIIVIGIFAFFALDWYNSLEDAPKIQLIPESIDFGQVSQAKGTVDAFLSVKNGGNSDLVIKNIVSSCGCTSATLIVDGTESPVFGMHTSYPNWSQKLVPGQTAELKVRYNPNTHQELRGELTRTLTIHSNDTLNSAKIVTISAYQVD